MKADRDGLRADGSAVEVTLSAAVDTAVISAMGGDDDNDALWKVLRADVETATAESKEEFVAAKCSEASIMEPAAKIGTDSDSNMSVLAVDGPEETIFMRPHLTWAAVAAASPPRPPKRQVPAFASRSWAPRRTGAAKYGWGTSVVPRPSRARSMEVDGWRVHRGEWCKAGRSLPVAPEFVLSVKNRFAAFEEVEGEARLILSTVLSTAQPNVGADGDALAEVVARRASNSLLGHGDGETATVGDNGGAAPEVQQVLIEQGEGALFLASGDGDAGVVLAEGSAEVETANTVAAHDDQEPANAVAEQCDEGDSEDKKDIGAGSMAEFPPRSDDHSDGAAVRDVCMASLRRVGISEEDVEQADAQFVVPLIPLSKGATSGMRSFHRKLGAEYRRANMHAQCPGGHQLMVAMPSTTTTLCLSCGEEFVSKVFVKCKSVDFTACQACALQSVQSCDDAGDDEAEGPVNGEATIDDVADVCNGEASSSMGYMRNLDVNREREWSDQQRATFASLQDQVASMQAQVAVLQKRRIRERIQQLRSAR